MELTERSVLPIDIDQNRACRHRVNALILDGGEVIRRGSDERRAIKGALSFGDGTAVVEERL